MKPLSMLGALLVAIATTPLAEPFHADGTQCQVGNASCTVPPQPIGSICYCGTVAGTTIG